MARTSIAPVSGDLATAARLVGALPGFLRRPLDPSTAAEVVRGRMRRRDATFLGLVRAFVFERAPLHPYRRLLDAAGCELGDLEGLVAREGIEGALLDLHARGVYLTVDEFKGRHAVVRGSARFDVRPSELLNPRAVAVLPRASSGSRGARTLVPLDLSSIRDQALDMCVGFAAHGGLDWSFAVWDVPGGAAIDKVLSTSAFGNRPARWFSQVDPASPALHPRYRWSSRLLAAISLGIGRPLPLPTYLPAEQPEPLLDWIVRTRRAGRTPCVRTYASSAVRLAHSARERGVSLEGARFSLGGEPITSERMQAIERSGATAHPTYGVIEAGPLGFGCARPAVADDIHLFSDRLALIQPAEGGPDHVPGALYLTSLLPSARVILLNTSLGDRATLEKRACGCPLLDVGWTTHVHSIRSFQKVTAAGMTFLDADVIQVLEEVLPRRFGGGPADYQLVEDEGPNGARLRLLVDPRIGPVDEPALIDLFLRSLGGGSGAERIMEMMWRETRLIVVARESPRTGSTGKILHFHRDARATRA